MAGSGGGAAWEGTTRDGSRLARGVPQTYGRKAKRRRRRSSGDTGIVTPGVTASTEGRQQRATADAKPRTGAPEGLPDLGLDRDLLRRIGEGELGRS